MTNSFAHLLTTDGSFDRAAIVKLAHKWARDSGVRFNERQIIPSYRDAFQTALRGVWQQAKAARAAFALPADEIARRDDRASLIFAAQMIDHTPTYIRAIAAIEARI